LGRTGWDSRNVVRALIEQIKPKLFAGLPGGGEGWRVHYALFTRSGITPAANAELQKHGGMAVDLRLLKQDLSA
jgi:hypothetical protein